MPRKSDFQVLSKALGTSKKPRKTLYCRQISRFWHFCGAPALGQFFCSPCGLLGCLLASTWDLLGASWAQLGALGRVLGGSWALLDGSWAALGRLLGTLGSHLEPLGRHLGALGGSRASLGASWARLGRHVGLTWSLLGASWATLVPHLEALGRLSSCANAKHLTHVKCCAHCAGIVKTCASPLPVPVDGISTGVR